jgi:hypothetical protein
MLFFLSRRGYSSIKNAFNHTGWQEIFTVISVLVQVRSSLESSPSLVIPANSGSWQ